MKTRKIPKDKIPNPKITRDGLVLKSLSTYVIAGEEARIRARAAELRLSVSAYLRLVALRDIELRGT